MVNEVTIDDPGAYSRPFKVSFEARLRVGDEIMEYICNENTRSGSPAATTEERSAGDCALTGRGSNHWLGKTIVLAWSR